MKVGGVVAGTTREKDYFYRYIKQHTVKKKNGLPNFIKEKAMMVNS